MNELITYAEIDYASQSELFQKLVEQAIAKLKNYLNEDDFINVVKYHKREIAALIYAQMKPHFYCLTKSYEEPIIKPFTRIEGHNLTKIKADGIHHFTDTITPTSAIPQKIFSGFKRACHDLYKFDGKGEKDFATILENDKEVVKWLRPAPKQFHIYWDHITRPYEPDFVVEAAGPIYLVEIKKEQGYGGPGEGESGPSILQTRLRSQPEKWRQAMEVSTHTSQRGTAKHEPGLSGGQEGVYGVNGEFRLCLVVLLRWRAGPTEA